MSNKNMTAVEWLVDQLEKWELYSKISFQCLNEIDKAKAMEKEQMKEMYLKGIENYDPTFKKTYEK
jgi:hypothetical protein